MTTKTGPAQDTPEFVVSSTAELPPLPARRSQTENRDGEQPVAARNTSGNNSFSASPRTPGRMLGGLTGTLSLGSAGRSHSLDLGSITARLPPISTQGRLSSMENYRFPRPNLVGQGGSAKLGKHQLHGTLAHGGRDSYNYNTSSDPLSQASYNDNNRKVCCSMCEDPIQVPDETFAPCECSFRLCQTCLEHVKKYEKNKCPGCSSELCDREQWLLEMSLAHDDETPRAADSEKPHSNLLKSTAPPGDTIMQMVASNTKQDMVPVTLSEYGYGTVAWQTPPEKNQKRAIPVPDTKKRSLFRTTGFGGGKIGPYRIFCFLRLIAIVGFLEWRITTPTTTGFWLWILSVICETWFAITWVLDTIPKLTPLQSETYKERLKAVYDDVAERLPQVDVFVTTADAMKEPPLITACTILSVLALNYPADRLACYLSDDGASKLMFDAMGETAGFARLWVPFCKRYNIEPRNPETYFSEKIDYLKDKIQPDFVKTRRSVKREFEEFKVRVNGLVAESRYPPTDGWILPDGTPWPGNNWKNHEGIIQVFLHPDGDIRDVEGEIMAPLVYVSREKRPGHEHNKKAGAMNALVRASALITNGPFVMNLDCDHYVNNSEALREAMCFFLDPMKGYNIGFVQFPQRFDGVDKNDRYANHNTVFFDINMKGLDGQQGPVYVGTGCFFRRRALYGYYPPSAPYAHEVGSDDGSEKKSVLDTLCCGACCVTRYKKKRRAKNLAPEFRVVADDEEQAGLVDGHKGEGAPANLGMCGHFVATATGSEMALEEQAPLSPRSMLSDVVLCISCDYEDNTDWGKDIGWMYGSVTEDILSGMKIHSRGWRSQYCNPDRPAFKGSAPLNMTDRLHQVERWATGAVEIFFSARNPLWSLWGTQLQLRQRIAYANNAIYPFTSLAIFTYCLLPPLALLTDLFFVPSLDRYAVCWFTAVIFAFIVTSVFELRWSGVSFEAWWRNEQFWVIAGTSSHFAAVIQGVLKVVGGLEIAFTLTSKGGDEGDGDELHTFRFSWLLLPGCFIGLFNIVGVIVGVGRAFGTTANIGSNEWVRRSHEDGDGTLGGAAVRLIGKLAFSFWVLIHLYPFGKGLMGKRNKAPTLVLVWSVLLVIVVALLWSNFVNGSRTSVI